MSHAAQTLRLKLDPKLVASIKGQGGAADPLGLGARVNVEGSWSDPRINALSGPEEAHAKLDALAQGLFGKGQGLLDGGLDTLMQGLGTILGPRSDSREREGRDSRNPPAGAKPSDRPGTSTPIGDFLRDLLGR